MVSSTLKISIPLLISTYLLISCGGNSNSVALKDSKLKLYSQSTLEADIKKGMLELYAERRDPVAVYTDDVATESSSTSDGGDKSGTSYSTTNLQVASVDEADRLKNNADYLYVAGSNSPEIKSYKANQASTSLIDTYQFTDENTSVDGFYLEGDKLFALTGKGARYYYDNWFEPYYWTNQSNQIWGFNSDNGELSKTFELELDGNIVSSRKIGSTLYVVNRFTPALEGIVSYANEQKTLDENKKIINESTLADLMPKFSLNGEDKKVALAATDCMSTSYDKGNAYTMSVISVYAIDLSLDEPRLEGKCFLGETESVYVSTEALYLGTTQYNYGQQDGSDTPDASTSNSSSTSSSVYYPPEITTDIHKFSLGESINYRGSTSVEGHLGWDQAKKSFRMGEHEGTLGVITYTGELSNSDVSPARLTMVREGENTSTTQKLEIASTLPNDDRPSALGKPGEQIYSTRFLGEKAYLVTFRTIDPLYILDLSDPEDPFVAGELEIEGYSDYLHPVSENYLIGIGKDAVAADNGFGDQGGAWYQGVKVSVFDVSDPQKPVEKDKRIIGKRGTSTAVSSSHHAFTSVQDGDSLRFAIPVSINAGELEYPEDPHPWSWYSWKHNGLYRFNIDMQTGLLTDGSAVKGNAQSQYESGGIYNHRSAVIGNTVHYLEGDDFISETW